MSKRAPYANIDIGKLDAEGRSLIWRAGDLQARWMLIDIAEAAFFAGHLREACSIIHAYNYLADRLQYELYPWPKNCLPADFGMDKAEARNA